MLLCLTALASCLSVVLSTGPVTVEDNTEKDGEWMVTQAGVSQPLIKTEQLEVTGTASNILTFTPDAQGTLLRLNLRNLKVVDKDFKCLDLHGHSEIEFTARTIQAAPGFYAIVDDNIDGTVYSESEPITETETPEPTNDGIDKTALALAVALPLAVIVAFIIGFLLGLCCSRRQVIHRNEPFSVQDHYRQPVNDRPIFQDFRA